MRVLDMRVTISNDLKQGVLFWLEENAVSESQEGLDSGDIGAAIALVNALSLGSTVVFAAGEFTVAART